MHLRRTRRRTASGRRSLAATLAVSLVVAGGSHVFAAPDDGDNGDAAEHSGVGSLAGSELAVVQGHDAVEQLDETGTLEEVAASAGLEPQELQDELLDDSSMFVTDSGLVGYADTLHDEHGAQQLDQGSAAASEPLTTAALTANVFDLNSRPASTRVLYLDFDGHGATDQAWASVGYPGTIASAAFDLDGDATSFSADERSMMLEVWQRVAEDYRAFDVNVTTRDPGPAGIVRTSMVDASYGQRVVITPSNFTGELTVIGVALLNVFGANADHAAYVFTDTPNKRVPKTIGEAVSHEAGHTFALSHDGGSASPSYYDGHGAWAPIMGRSISPSTPVTQWSRGEYAGATLQEDDLAQIAARSGYRPDDHGGTASSATVVAANSTTIANIERTGDRDVFAVDVLGGALSVQLRPPDGEAAWSNLAATLTIRDGSGAVVAAAGPAVPSGWLIDLAPSVPAGRYSLEVEPVGWLTASTGFTTYGSLGAYELVVSAAQAVPTSDVDAAAAFTPVTPDRLVDTRSRLGAPGRLGPGRQIVVQVAGGRSVPATATAAVVNVAAVNPGSPGFITVYPCSDNVPDTSTLNFVAGQTVANTTIAALSGAGQLCVWSLADTDVLVDITGWIGPDGVALLTPIGPTRVVDTRSGSGGMRLAAGATMSVDFNGVVPAGTSAVALNVTGVVASNPGFITVFPCGSRPNTSTVNYAENEARPNNTIVGLTDGRVCIYSDQATDILVDLVGAFGRAGLQYQPTAPIRVLDSRVTGTPGPGGIAGYSVGAAALGATTPGAAYVNVTAANHLAPGYVTTFDCVSRRDTSTVNQRVGQAAANGAIVPLNALQSCAWTFGGGDLIVDLNGWWVP